VNTGDLFIAALLLLLKGKAAASSKPEKAAEALTSISTLQARASQEQARSWEKDLLAAGASPDLARALVRWIGIESSGYGAGDPRATSRLNEKGLLQISPTTAKEALTPGEWQSLADPATSRAEQARIALKQYRWHRDRAKRYVGDWPGDDTFDAVWYSKLHHQRPKDLSDLKLKGTAAGNARAVAKKWAGDSKALQRLAAANVVTWGSIESP
jgi:hypothetical protein